MKLTIEELRKVYSLEKFAFEYANFGASGIDAGLLALARFVEQKVREQEPTEDMVVAGANLGITRFDAYEAYRAMQSVAPSVVPE